VAGENRGQYFLIGIVLGGLIGAGIAIWIVESRRVRFRKQGAGFGGRVAEFISVVRDEFIPGLRDAIRQSAEEETEVPHRMSPDEEGFGEENEV
jgi:gas vesicle protein